MPFLRPGLGALHEQALNDMQGSPLRWAVSKALAWAVANLANGHYGYLDWIARQAVPFTATAEYLEAWAGLVGVLRKPAAPAKGTGTWAGAPGTVLPAGTAAARPDGVRYLVQADSAVSGAGVVSCALVAETPGAAGNADAGTALALASSVAGINSVGASGVLAAGADQEDDDGLRSRMLARYAASPQGGAEADYLEWAAEVPGVTRAWVAPNGFGAGTVVIYTMWDQAEAARQGLPQGTDGVATGETRDPVRRASGDQLAVADHLFTLRPVTALVYSVAPVPDPIAFSISSQATVPAMVRALIPAALDAVFRAKASPGGSMQPSDFYAALRAVPGMPPFDLVTPAGVVSSDPGHIAIRGAVAYV